MDLTIHRNTRKPLKKGHSHQKDLSFLHFPDQDSIIMSKGLGFISSKDSEN